MTTIPAGFRNVASAPETRSFDTGDAVMEVAYGLDPARAQVGDARWEAVVVDPSGTVDLAGTEGDAATRSPSGLIGWLPQSGQSPSRQRNRPYPRVKAALRATMSRISSLRNSSAASSSGNRSGSVVTARNPIDTVMS